MHLDMENTGLGEIWKLYNIFVLQRTDRLHMLVDSSDHKMTFSLNDI